MILYPIFFMAMAAASCELCLLVFWLLTICFLEAVQETTVQETTVLFNVILIILFHFSKLPPAKSLLLCPILCNSVDGSQPGSSVHGIPQARILEWVTTPSFRAVFLSRDQTHISYISCIGRVFVFVLFCFVFLTTSVTWISIITHSLMYLF